MLVSLIKDLFKRGEPEVQDELARVHQLLGSSQPTFALRILEDVLRRSPDNTDALLLRASVKRMTAAPHDAIPDLVRAQELGADPAECHFQQALCWTMLGDRQQAIFHGEKARELVPSSAAAFSMLTDLYLPGEYYTEVLAQIISQVAPTTYVEIGVFQGHSLKLAKSATAIVGIDPDPKIDWALEPHMKVFKSTSDDFFANHNLSEQLGGLSVDLAFIDGMHRFEFAMRDFANVERYARKDSVVLVHDCYPLDEESSGREPRVSSWSGDVWRLIVLLKKYRPDLIIHTIGAAPTGLAVIQNLDPSSTFLLDNQQTLFEEFLALDYSYLHEDKPSKLNLFPNTRTAIEELIKPRVAPGALSATQPEAAP